MRSSKLCAAIRTLDAESLQPERSSRRHANIPFRFGSMTIADLLVPSKKMGRELS